MLTTRFLVASILLILLLSACVVASVPPMISYQGKLMQPSGASVPDGAYAIQFAIYDLPTGGTALWSEPNPSVQVKNGLFSVLIGSINNLPGNIFDNAERYFALKVGTDPEMTPRQKIATVAFSFRANVAATVDDGAITTAKLADQSVTAAKLMPGAATPTGTVSMFAASSPPAGWLVCDGSAVSRTTYAALFGLTGATYGAGDGSTTFNLPDLRTRVAVGLSSTVTEFNALGMTGGEVKHTLSVAEMPSHTHVQNAHSHLQDAHGHSLNSDVSCYSSAQDDGWIVNNNNPDRIHAIDVQRNVAANNTTATNQNTTATSQNTGGGQAFSVLQPYVVVNYIIKT